MPDPIEPHRRPPALTATLTGLAGAHATAHADPEGPGLVVVSVGSVDVRLVLAGHAGAVLGLLSDALHQVEAIEAGR